MCKHGRNGVISSYVCRPDKEDVQGGVLKAQKAIAVNQWQNEAAVMVSAADIWGWWGVGTISRLQLLAK